MTGLQAPTKIVEMGVIFMFPSASKKYFIESCIESYVERDYLSTQSMILEITDSFIEFHIADLDNEIADLSSLTV